MKLNDKKIDAILKILDEELTKMKSEDFCGCYEGDLYGNYWEGCNELIYNVKKRLKGDE